MRKTTTSVGIETIVLLPPMKAENVPAVEIDGQWYKPTDEALPPLLVGVFSATNKLVDIHRLTDPRTEFCNLPLPDLLTGPILVRPLVPSPPVPSLPTTSPLSERELLVCALMVAGMSPKQMAAYLDCAFSTVGVLRDSAARKLKLGDVPLIVWAARNSHLLPDVPPAVRIPLEGKKSRLRKRPEIPPEVRKKRIPLDGKPSELRKRPAPRRSSDPTPEEIAERAAEIRNRKAM